MPRRRVLIGLAALSLAMGVTMSAHAGGYAVVHLDEKPAGVMATLPWRFGFMVLQHDVTPNSDVTPVVQAAHALSGETVQAIAVQEGPEGHFVAEITFPRAGEWTWSIEPEPFAETPFATLTVLEPTIVHSWPASSVRFQLANSHRFGPSASAPIENMTDTQTVEILAP